MNRAALCSFQNGKLGSSQQVTAVMESCKGRHFLVMGQSNLFPVGEVMTTACLQRSKEAGRNKEVNTTEPSLPAAVAASTPTPETQGHLC